MPSWPTVGAWPAAGAWPSVGAWPTAGAWPVGGVFNGNFASLFSNVLQSVQTDLGLTYGGTLLAAAGNTSTTVITLTGTLSAAVIPGPLNTQATNSLAIGSGGSVNIFFKGNPFGGSTPGIGTPIDLTAIGAPGLFLTWSAGTNITGDTWNATCSGLADQTVAHLDYSQATLASQPLITTGLNGFPGLQFDTRFMASSLNLPAPATTPTFRFAVFRCANWAAANHIFASNTGSMSFKQASVTPQIALCSVGNGCLNGGAALNAWVRAEGYYTGSASDYLKLGSTVQSDAAAGNTAGTGMQIGLAGTAALNREMLVLVYTSSLPSGAQLAAASAAVTSKYAGLVAV